MTIAQSDNLTSFLSLPQLWGCIPLDALVFDLLDVGCQEPSVSSSLSSEVA